ncbi:MAG: hypothetical protein AAFN79_13915 [Pseudomonadota bacterium]
MLRDLVITCVLIVIAIAGLWLAGIGRETMAGAYQAVADRIFGEEIEEETGLSLADVEGMLLSQATWCYWPDISGSCAWAMRVAQRLSPERYDVDIYAIDGFGPQGMKIAVARTGLMIADGRFCDDPSRATTRARLRFYTDIRNAVAPDAQMRTATGLEFATFQRNVGDPREAARCFAFSVDGEMEGETILLQSFLKDGAPDGEPAAFSLRPGAALTRLRPPR